MCERQGIAEQAALAEHPVVRFVKGLPIEDPRYPAIEYLRLAQQVGRDVWDVFHEVQEGRREFPGRDGTPIRFDPVPHEFVTWSMPAHDLRRPEDKKCGFIRSPSGSIVYTMCPDHPEHYLKGKRKHCWSLHCPSCMNDTALKHGVKIERQLLVYQKLCEKQGIDVGNIGHWVVSPPQELAKCMMQTYEDFDMLQRYVDDTILNLGGKAGVTVFHPWRQKEDYWELSPHFHVLCYGFLNTKRFLKENPGWIIKKVHPRERIRSIRHTAAYLSTHMGLGLVEHSPEDVDWDLDLLDHMVPGIKSPSAKFSESDYEDLSEGKGRMCGDLSGMDWTRWAEDRLSRETRIRYWGGVARNRIRLVGIHRQYKIRACQECGEMLRTYEGTDDTVGSYVRYIQDNPILSFAEHFEQVKTVYLRFKDDLRVEGMTLSDFSYLIPFAVSTLELGLPSGRDLVMEGPFQEPDEYFIRRQRVAFSES